MPAGTERPLADGGNQSAAGAAIIPCDNSAADLHAKGREVTAMDYWELFCDTGAPEAYLLWRGQQEAVCKTEKQ